MTEQELPPEDVRVLPNGAWQNKSTGKIVKAAPDALFDSKRASEAANKRWAAVQQASRDGIREAVQEERPEQVLKDFPGAHKEVVKTLTREVVLNPKVKGKARVDSYHSLLVIEGSAKPAKEAGVGTGEGVTISFSPKVAAILADRVARYMAKGQADVIDVDPVLVEEE
jgi:hypothetical protein